MTYSRKQNIIRTIIGWTVVGLFFFPIYFWTSVAFRNGKDIFNWPPIIFDFEPTFTNFRKVFGITLGDQSVNPGGGNFYMAPRLWDSDRRCLAFDGAGDHGGDAGLLCPVADALFGSA